MLSSSAKLFGLKRFQYQIKLRPYLCRYTTEPTGSRHEDIQTKEKTFHEKFRDTWNGPTFKYWAIGTTAFFSWLAYYGLQAYKKTRIDVEIMPQLPNDVKVERKDEIDTLLSKQRQQSNWLFKKKLKKLFVYGAPGTGKTTLVHDFVQHVLAKQNGHAYSIPKSNVAVFMQCDSEQSFLNSLKAFAVKLKIKPSELEEELGPSYSSFNLASFEMQIDILMSCIQDALKKHAGWVMVFDNVLTTTPEVIWAMLNKWFMNKDNHVSNWSSGSVVIVYEGSLEYLKLREENKFSINKGLSLQDGKCLLKEVSNLEEAVVNTPQIQQLIERVYSNPLGVLAVSVLLREKLSQKEIVSIEGAVKELLIDIDANVKDVSIANRHMSDFITTPSGMTLVTIETVVAMAVKSLLEKDTYLYHGFDLISALKPSANVPGSLIARHLRTPFYRLPPLMTNSGGLAEFFNKQKSDLDAVKSKADEFEPKGKAWSNKNLAEYVRKVEDFFMLGVNTVKDIYNLVYGVLPELPEKADGLDMFRKCELLTTSVISPGGNKAIGMHPIVYNAVRQHFLSSTIHEMEEEHLLQSQVNYQHQAWFRRLGGFSDQACLQTFRQSSGHVDNEPSSSEQIQPAAYVSRYNSGIDISPVFKKPHVPDTEDFRQPKDIDKFRYLQGHLARVVTSVCDEIYVTKSDQVGRSLKRNLLGHLQYILDNHPRELFGTPVYINALQTLADCHIELYNDHYKSKEILEDILKIQNSATNTSSLDKAKTMGKIAEIHNAFNEVDKARKLLEEAASLHEADRKKFGEYRQCYDYGKLLGLLGIVYASLSMKIECKETIERSLMLKQATPPDLADEAKSKKFGIDFASSLTDLGHSYVSLGMPLYGRKILDLALSAHRNLNGDNHPEVVRTLTVLAVAHLMQGNNEESKKLRKEAGKLQLTINSIPMY